MSESLKDYKLMDFIDRFYCDDLMFEEYNGATLDCPMCQGNGDARNSINAYMDGIKCMSCGYVDISYIEKDIMSPDYMKNINKKGHPVYVGKIYYNSIPDKEKKKNILRSNLIKLFETIEEKKNKLQSDPGMSYAVNMSFYFWPIDIWRQYHFWKPGNKYGLIAPETIDEALEQLDALLEIVAIKSEIEIFEKLDGIKEDEAIRSLLSRDIDMDKSYFYVFDPKTYIKRNIIKEFPDQKTFEDIRSSRRFRDGDYNKHFFSDTIG